VGKRKINNLYTPILQRFAKLMRAIFISILTICLSNLQAQTVATKPVSAESKKEFKNQGDQEDFWAEQLFEKDYKKLAHEKYKGDIVVNGNFFKYADQVFEVNHTSKELSAIFSKGLFYPSIITGLVTAKPKSKEELNEMTTAQRATYGLIRTDSLGISLMEEVPFLSKSPTQKRFRFWLIRKGRLNPQVCFIELTNQNATSSTDMETFINEAELTFYKEAWIII
jgi:hypothetical protein